MIKNSVCSGIDIVLLAAFAEAINIWNSSDKIMIAYESHGRQHEFQEINISRTIGWFTSIFPIIIEANNNLSTEEYLKLMDELVKDVSNSGHGYGCLKYLTDTFKEYDNEPQIGFNYLGNIEKFKDEGFEMLNISRGKDYGDFTESLFSLFLSAQKEHNNVIGQIMYNSIEYNKSTIEEVLELMLLSLRKIISITVNSFNSKQNDGPKYYSLLNNIKKSNKSKIFLFPPHMVGIAYQALYHKLTKYIDEYNFIMFDMHASDY